jgi:hypothetical protein
MFDVYRRLESGSSKAMGFGHVEILVDPRRNCFVSRDLLHRNYWSSFRNAARARRSAGAPL